MMPRLSNRDINTEIDVVLSHFFQDAIAQSQKIDKQYARLWKNLYDLLQSGGKRLRPRMTVLSYEAYGGTEATSILPIAAAQELLHFCLLIHDDIIDRDYIRYGTENIAGRYRNFYSQHLNSKVDITHFAHSAALLGGDLMLSGAYQMIASSALSQTQKDIANNYLSRGIFEVAGGELLDTELSFMEKEYKSLKVARYKTAGYSFVSPILTGAKLAHIPKQEVEALTSFARSLGIAFQLVDDIIGIFGDTKTTGKSTSSDIEEGKKTYLVECALNRFTSEQQDTFAKLYGNPATDAAGMETIKQLLTDSGARSSVENKIEDYAQKARTDIETLNISPSHKEAFTQLINLVTRRTH